MERLTGRGRFSLVPFIGYANDEQLIVRGRVLRERRASLAERHTSAWRNFIALVRLANSAEVSGAKVCAHFRARDYEARTDDEGYFEFDIKLSRRLERDVELEMHLHAPRAADGAPVVARASIYAPPASARFGVISDIDDTIVWTHVGNRRRMLWTLARSNARTRKPLAGVAALYHALRDGGAGDEGNPIFYVSNGPWNLFPPLVDFMRINVMPLGPVFLKDWSRHLVAGWRDHGTHKLKSIREVLNAFAHLPFVLMGDSSERDPEIYRAVVREFPGRIVSIYIRSVAASAARCAAIERLADEVRSVGSDLVLITDSEAVAIRELHAGRIRPDRLQHVRLDEDAERRLPALDADPSKADEPPRPLEGNS